MVAFVQQEDLDDWTRKPKPTVLTGYFCRYLFVIHYNLEATDQVPSRKRRPDRNLIGMEGGLGYALR